MLDRLRRPITDDIRQDRYALTHRIFEVAEAGEAHEVNAGLGVWLTLSEADPAVLADVFPKLRRTLERCGWVGDDVLVYPFLHYYLGGFGVGRDGQTHVPGLYLAGEMVGGLHGLNRLMGNGTHRLTRPWTPRRSRRSTSRAGVVAPRTSRRTMLSR